MMLKIAADTKAGDAAGAIAGQLREHAKVEVQAIGAGAVNQAVKAIALAQAYLDDEHHAVASRMKLVDLNIDGRERTAVRFLVIAAQTRSTT